jgi:drug/metabolite transporter (DMT)-like permease
MVALTYLLIATTTICTLAAQLILKKALNSDPMRDALIDGPLSFIFSAALHPLVWLALSLQVTGYVAWFFVLTRERLAVSFAISGAMLYVLMAVAAWFFYAERLTLLQWSGIALISVGVVLVVNHR